MMLCDRCGTQVKEPIAIYVGNPDDDDMQEAELCHDCWQTVCAVLDGDMQ
jgi:hypothetical protein